MGSRYGGLKQIDAMGPSGEIMLDYSVTDASAAGFRKVVFVIRRDIESAFREVVGDRFLSQVEVEYVFQDLGDLPPDFSVPKDRVKPWGTAHAVRAARSLINEPFAVINADDFYGREAYQTLADWLIEQDPGQIAAAMVSYPLGNTLSDFGVVNRGICSVEHHLLQRIEEFEEISRDEDQILRGTPPHQPRIELDENASVSLNFWGFTPAVFPLLEQDFKDFLTERSKDPKSEWYLPEAVDRWIRSGLVQCPVLESNSQWFGVTYPEDKERVQIHLRRLTER